MIVWAGALEDISGYGTASRDYAKSLLNINANIRTFSVKYDCRGSNNKFIDSDDLKVIKDFEISINELNRLNNFTFLWHSSPNAAKTNKKAIKNILMTVWETDQVPFSFEPFIRPYDYLLTASEFSKNSFLATFPDLDIRVIPHILHDFRNKEISVNDKFYDKAQSVVKDKFVFFWNAEWHIGKGYDLLLKGFCEAFKDNDDVILLLKTYNLSTTNYGEQVINYIKNFKQENGYSKPKIFPIIGDLPYNDVLGLYALSDTYISTSRREGFCLVPDSKIITENGLENIQNIKDNTKVISHNGVFRNSYTNNRNYEGSVYKFFPNYVDSFTVTNEHPLLVLDFDKYKGKCRRTFLKKCRNNFNDFLVWKQAKNVTINDLLCIPRFKRTISGETCVDVYPYIDDNNFKLINDLIKSKIGHEDYLNRFFNFDQELMWLFGIYLSKGCSNKYGQILFSLNSNEVEYQNKILEIMKNKFNLIGKLNFSKDKNVTIIRFNSSVLANLFINWFGEGAHNKTFPNFFYNFNDDLLVSFCKGQFDGDGYYLYKTDRTGIQFTTVSRNLFAKTATLLKIILPRCFSAKRKKRGEYVIQINGSDNCKIFNNGLPDKHNYTLGINTDNYYFVNLRNIKKEKYFGKVYNLEVDHDRSFNVNGIAIHNSLTASEALGFGLPVIAPNMGGHCEFLNKNNSIKVESKWEDVNNLERSRSLYGGQKWIEINIEDFIYKLRKVYNNRNYYLTAKFQKEISKILKKFSEEEISKQLIKELVNAK